MSPTRALLVPDTNLLLDMSLSRDGKEGLLLLGLVEQGHAEMVVPEYVLAQFQGTGRRLIRDYSKKLAQFTPMIKQLLRNESLIEGARLMDQGTDFVLERLPKLEESVPLFVERLSSVARIAPQSLEAKLRGELRYKAERPPADTDSDDSDCCIYEALLEIARADQINVRPKFFVTRDSDFDHPELKEELAGLGFKIRKDIGRLFGELRRPS